ncbi:dynamin family protein [Bacillaceae bacterium S4-13-58]
MNQSKTINLSHSLAGLYHWFYERNEVEIAEQMLDLLKKEREQGISIGFSGHYSAGKSSLINYLVGQTILPSSPIPTSANIVEIYKGDERVRLVQQNGELIQVSGPTSLDDVRQYCKDGDLVKRIILSKEDIELPLGVTLIDTPGIDSAKDADAILTESTLHTIDVLFYVVDYNHVQSEHNLYFLQQMQKRKKPYYLVVHQIDKHEDRESTFENYKEKINQVLHRWNINPKAVYYTSLYDENNTHNQLTMLQNTIEEWERGIMDLSYSTIQSSIHFILEEFIYVKRQEWEEKKESLMEQRNKILEDLELLHKNSSTPTPNTAEVEMNQLIKQIGQRAQITPYELREKARVFLTVMQPEYKSGLFFSKTKTEQEKKEATEQFYHDLMKLVEANLQWPIRQKVSQYAQELGVSDPKILSSLEGISIHFPKERLKEIIKPGTKATGDYLLLYMEDVKQNLIKAFVKEAQTQWEKANDTLEKNYQEFKEVEEKVKSLQNELYQTEKKIEVEEQEWKQVESGLLALEDGEIKDTSLVQAALDKIHTETYTNLESFPIKNSYSNELVKNKQQTQRQQKQKIKKNSKKEMANLLEDTVSKLSELKSASLIKRALLEKKNSLETNEYTIALFGAFSAGKSSFINAMLGKSLMPVSAHPTTATITRVLLPPTVDDNQKVKITVKSEEELKEELMDVFDQTNLPNENIEKELKKLKKKVNSDPLEHWVDSLLAGYQKMADSLGKTITVPIAEMENFIKDEERASYIQKVDIFDDNPLTRAGIILVDTPGADSVHSRHTRLSFQFIKDSDAIIYVSYYNHSFAKADASFLYQLGRIQDAFNHNKMFFVVNAVDLAKNDRELELVLNYVSDELSKFDIQGPRLYPVSSKIAIEADGNSVCENKSGVPAVKEELFDFINHEIDNILVQQAKKELDYSIQWLDERIREFSLNQEERQKKVEERKSLLENIKRSVLIFSDERYLDINDQKLKQQFFHMQKRMVLRSMDVFKETVNPSTIKANGKVGRTQLINQLHNFFHHVRNKLIQDLVATSLRIDHYMKDQINHWKADMIENTKDMNYFIHERKANCNIPTPNISLSSFVALDKDIQSIAAGFKSTKEFFEQRQVNQVKDEVEQYLRVSLQKELRVQTEELLSYYRDHWNKVIKRERDQLQQRVNEIVVQENQQLFSYESVEKLSQIKKQIEELIY